ncbi:MAG: hypothetical protein AAF928_12945 [Myxococcota bacterium]
MRIPVFLGTVLALLVPGVASATTYQVGPTADHPDVQSLMQSVTLAAGDVVEVEGDHLYPGDLWLREEAQGEPGNPIVFRGLRKNGQRPRLQGVGTEQWHDMVVFLAGNHMVFEGFEIIGDDDTSHSCIITQGDDIVIRDVWVHGCAGQGILATDWGTGDLTIEYSEFSDNGSGNFYHSIYVTTDQDLYPGSRVRIQFNYVHDLSGGLAIKSRAERGEVYFNWIEGAPLNALDLIGPDADADDAREDTDVVGNVIYYDGIYAAARIGDDGTNGTDGRYRFAYNTFVIDGPGVVFRPQVNIDALEVYNNVFIALNGATPRMYDEVEYSGTPPVVMGSHNFIGAAFTAIPSEFTETLTGEPGLADPAGFDFRPVEGSLLIDAGTTSPFGPERALPNPLTQLDYVPPPRVDAPAGMPYARNPNGMPDIGAYAFGSGTEPGPGGPPPSGGGSGGSSSAGGGGADGPSDGSDADDDWRDRDDGCHLSRTPGRHGTGGSGGEMAVIAALGLAAASRRRRARG